MAGTALPLGLLALALAWGGPVWFLLGPSFTGGMVMHMGVVAIAAPLIAIGLSGSRWDITRRWPRLCGPLVASVLEFAAVWGWHMPGPHEAARAATPFLLLEQGSFLATGLLVWLSCLGAGGERQGGGILALLLTSMHMTLLGALLTLAPRPLYDHEACLGLTVLEDQSLGGVVMLLVGGAAYLAGGLALAARLLNTGRGAPC
ncbi:MAG: Cytochrome c oxidase caa3-type, assembly factor CtaG-related protein [Roseomonas sp.]|nr:Cytochrome c oxidase caa3-type, assembly factor CtaG-related protein [Roseomonas sp.]